MTLTLTLLGAGWAGGCASLNRGPAITDDYYIEAIAPERVPRAFARIEAGDSDAPSIKTGSLDRSSWTIRRVVVPAGVLQHRPTYATGPTFAQGTSRQRGEFPTLDTALEIGGEDAAWSEIFEGLAWPFWAGLDIALMPARMIAQPPWETVNSPDWPSERAPGGTASPRMLGDNTSIPVPGLGTRPTVPSLAEARWIWYKGRWYYWKPGAAEPWVEPPEGAYPAPPVTEPRWVWRSGKWYLWKLGEPEPWLAPPHAAPVPSPATPPETPARPPQPQAAPPGTEPTSPPAAPSPALAPEVKPALVKPRWVFRNGKWVREDSASPPAEPRP